MQTRYRNVTLLLTSSLTIMSAATIAPSLPQMAEVFKDIPNADFLAKLILTLPTLFIAIIAPYAGKFVDRYGRIRLLLLGMILYAIAGSSGYVLNNLYHILAGRIILGLAIGIIMTISITLIGDYFQGEARQRFVGLQVSFVSFGGVLFIGAGGLLADISWRCPFLIYLFSLILLPMAWRFLQEPKRFEPNAGNSASVRLDKSTLFLYATTFFIWVTFFMIPVQIPFYIKSLGVTQNSLIGAAIATNTAFAAVSSLFYSRLKKRFSFQQVFAIGFILMAGAYVWIWQSVNYQQTVIALMISGIAIGWIVPNTTLWMIQLTPPPKAGERQWVF